MSSVRRLYERFRHLIHEGSKFLVIGAIGTVITFVVANALHGVGRYKAVTIATILATVFTFLGNRYWTFKHREGQGTTRDSIVFFVLNGIGLLIYYGCIGLTDLAGLGKSKLWYNIALVVGTGLGTLFRFWSYRKWVWVAADVPRPGSIRATRGAGGGPRRRGRRCPAHPPRRPDATGSRPGSASASHRGGLAPAPAAHRAPASHRRTAAPRLAPPHPHRAPDGRRSAAIRWLATRGTRPHGLAACEAESPDKRRAAWLIAPTDTSRPMTCCSRARPAAG